MKIKRANIKIYDNGGKTFDRFTVVYLDRPERQPRTYACVGMSEHPFHPQGFGQHSSAMPGRHLGKRITFDQLPPDCQKLVRQDLQPRKEHVHEWGPVEHSRFCGTPHRKCLKCGFVSLDLEDDCES